MTVPELSRKVGLHDLGSRPVTHKIEASEAERAALAVRFDLARLDKLTAEFAVKRDAAGVRVTGRVTGAAVQACVVSGADVAARIDEAVDVLAAPLDAAPDEEIELGEADLDVVPLDGDSVDLGEIAAESFGLALEPFPRAPGAVLRAPSVTVLTETEATAARNPFRVLKGGKD